MAGTIDDSYFIPEVEMNLGQLKSISDKILIQEATSIIALRKNSMKIILDELASRENISPRTKSNITKMRFAIESRKFILATLNRINQKKAMEFKAERDSRIERMFVDEAKLLLSNDSFKMILDSVHSKIFITHETKTP